MKSILLLSLIFLTGCATKYIVPGNRFITPETQGEPLKGQAEFQQTSAQQLTFDTKNGSLNDGVNYSATKRMGLLVSEGVFNTFDLIWSHTGSSTSMLGGKFQLYGSSRNGTSEGHKAAIGYLMGGNAHETDDNQIDFRLDGQEFLFLYGYRLSSSILPYSNFSIANYDFKGKVSKNDPVYGGRKISSATKIYSLSGGIEFSYDQFFGKVEATYQQLETSHTKDMNAFLIGYSLGVGW